jgi:hypothetical protein
MAHQAKRIAGNAGRKIAPNATLGTRDSHAQ